MNKRIAPEQLEKAIDRLHPFPRALAVLLTAVEDESATMAGLAQTIATDPVLVAAILKEVNARRRIRGEREIVRIDMAVQILGTEEIKKIALRWGGLAYLRTNPVGDEQFFHWIAVAVAAEELAQVAGYSGMHAYVAGLFHDIGQLIFYTADPKGYAELWARRLPTKYFLEAEADRYGMTHCEAGRMLSVRWELPAEIGDGIAYHHEDHVQNLGGALPKLISLAETLACALDLPKSPRNCVDRVNDAARAELGIDWNSKRAMESFGRICARYQQALRRLMI